jgi:hypothetical protein
MVFFFVLLCVPTTCYVVQVGLNLASSWVLKLQVYTTTPSPQRLLQNDFLIFIYFFLGTGIWTQGLTVVRQVLYCLSHSCSISDTLVQKVLLFSLMWICWKLWIIALESCSYTHTHDILFIIFVAIWHSEIHGSGFFKSRKGIFELYSISEASIMIFSFLWD